MRTSIFSHCYFTLTENSLIESLLDRSNLNCMILASLFLDLISLMAYSDLTSSRAPNMMVQFLFDSSSIVAFPIPVLPPVTTMICPVRSRVTLHTPPLKYFLMKNKAVKKEAVMAKNLGEVASYLVFSIIVFILLMLYDVNTKIKLINT